MLTHPTGRLSTPGFPNGYPANTVCEWTIQVDYGSSIQLTLEKFYIEKSTDCSYDAVEVNIFFHYILTCFLKYLFEI